MGAADNNLDLALRLKADATQAKAALAEVQAQIKGVEQASVNASAASAASSKTAAAAAGQEAEAVAGVATAQTARAETEAEAAARIHAMVQASLEAVDAERARVAAMASSSQSLHVAADANSAFAKSSASMVAAQDAAMVSFVEFNKAAKSAEAAMTALKSGTLTTAAFEKASADLAKAVGIGAITEEEYEAALKLVDKAKVEDIVITKSQSAANKEAMLSSRAQSEIATAISEVLSGNVGRLRRTGAAFANQAGLLTKLMTPMGIGIAAAAVAVGAFVIAIVKGEEESDKFNRALIATGAASTATAGQLVDTANRVGAATGRYGDAAEALTELANTGKFTRTQMEQLSQTAVEFATMTGGKVADGVKFVDQVMSGNVDTLMKLDEQYHFLSASQFDQIQRLQAQGETERATAIAQQAASKAVHDRANEVQDSAGIMERAWSGVKEAASAAWNAMKDVGATHSIGQRLKDAMADLANAQGTHLDRAGNMVQNASPEALAQLRAKIADLRHQLAVQGFDQTQAAVAQGAETKSKQGLQYLSQFQSAQTKLDNAKAQAKAAFDKAMLGKLTADQVAQAKAEYEQALKVAQQQFDSANKKQFGNVDSAQLNAAISAAQNAVKQAQDIFTNGQKALDAQHKAGLVSDAAYYDAERGMLTVWEDDKVAALEKEKVAAQSHIKTQADRVKADQKVADIDQQITQVHAEASAKRQQIDAQEQEAIKKTQAAWEKFQNSLGTPLEIHTGQVLNKLNELDQFFTKNSTGGEAGYADALNRIFGGIDGRGPRGVNTLMAGSRFSAQMAEVKQYYADIASIQQKAYQQEMAAAQGNAQRQLDIQKAYEQASLQSAQNKANAEAAIKRQEAQFALSSAQQGFTALAQVYAQAYGEQSRQAKIAFALQKASTLANAILAIQESVANSSKMGFPWNIISIAGAIAQGAAVLATIRSTNLNVGGYATGGAIHGAGTGTSDSITIRASNGEYMHNAAAVDHYGLAFMDAVNSRTLPKLPGYATGGLIGGSAPTPSQLGFKSPSTPTVGSGNLMVAVTPVTVIVHSSGDGGDVKSQQSTDNNGGQALELFLGAVAKDVNNGGVIAKAMDRRWVLKRKGNSYG